MIKYKSFCVIPFIMAMLSFSVSAQVTIAPTNLFISDNNRFGTYMVINGSDQTQEISIEFFFGYSITDDEGNAVRVREDTTEIANNSIADNIRAFPQNFTLAPGQRQVVRLRITPPNDLSDGTYWARIETSATPESPPIEIQSENAVTASVGINIKQVTGIFYKKGLVNTGIEVDAIRTIPSGEGYMTILTDYKRLGNSPFLGTITVTLLNDENEIVNQSSTSTSIYFDGTHQRVFDTENLDPGNYTIRVDFESRRSDVSQDDIIQMSPVTSTSTVTIP